MKVGASLSRWKVRVLLRHLASYPEPFDLDVRLPLRRHRGGDYSCGQYPWYQFEYNVQQHFQPAEVGPNKVVLGW